MLQVKDKTSPYLADFARLEKQAAPAAMQRLRKAGMARFSELGFPGPRDEEWRFTSVGPLAEIPFVLQTSESAVPRVPPGVTACTLLEALQRHPKLIEPHLARHADHRSHAFIALNTAFLHDGLFVHVPKGLSVEQPIDLSLAAPYPVPDVVAGVTPLAHHRRHVIVLEAGSNATIVENFSGLRFTYFTNAVTEVVLGDNASLDHYKVQREGRNAFHFHALQVQQERGSKFASHSITLGGRWTRNEVTAMLGGEGCDCTLNGVYLADGDRLVDNHTRIDHAKPHCTSHELYKGILDGKARGVFNGKIFVHKDAQKTDARQTNQTLLLSDDAVIDTKPQLEIYADDVKCTHGASIGQLDEEAMYYLRTRGIDAGAARRLLTYAFANDIVGRVKVPALREELERALEARE